MNCPTRIGIAKAFALIAASVPLAGLGDTPDPDNPPSRPHMDEGDEYVGTKRCRMCHGPWYESWKKTPKAHAFELLKPGIKPKAKTINGLDAQKDYTAEPRCLACHTVGYGRPGGYAIPDPNDKKSARLAATRQGVGCESCHGPGGGFTKVMADIYKTERPYDPRELHDAGLRRMKLDMCKQCHDPAAPCIPSDSESFVVDERTIRKGLGFHEHFPLRFRKQQGPSQSQVSSPD